MRSIPGLVTIRPADANEATAAWRVALERREGPTALALSRQSLPILEATADKAGRGVARGGYILADPASGEPQLMLIATGSEVALCVAASQQLATQGIATRVVSLPSWELFEMQPQKYRQTVLPATIGARLAVEAGVTLGWHRYVGDAGDVLGIDGFGGSAPYEDLAASFGFTVDRVVERARRLLES
jgi:transketolase